MFRHLELISFKRAQIQFIILRQGRQCFMPEEPTTKKTQIGLGRQAAGWLVILVLAAYTVGIISGKIDKSSRLDATAITLIVCGVVAGLLLISPQVFDRIQLVEVASFKLQLSALKKQQDTQKDQIDTVDVLLPILFPHDERKHLQNLLRHKTSGYVGGHNMRTELRRLRSVGLIHTQSTKNIGDMADGKTFDLKDYVALTTLGVEWATRFEHIEKVEKA